MKAQQFLDILGRRLAIMRAVVPVPADHPLAMSYTLGLRVDGDNNEHRAQANAGGLPLPGAASTNQISGRLIDDVNSEHSTDKKWKQGYSAAEAYGQLLDEEFGAGTAAAQADFAEYGRKWLYAPGDEPPWMPVALSFLPSLKSGDRRANVARYVLGTRDETKLSEGENMEIKRGAGLNLFRVVPGRNLTVDASSLGIFRQGQASEPTTGEGASSSSSAPAVGGVAGAALGAAAGYFFGGRSPLFAGLGALVGGGVGYLGTSYAAK